jgi:hypothetical protein
MKSALEIPGYNEVYHYFNSFSNARDHDIWVPLLKAKYSGQQVDWRAQFNKVIGHCAAVSDTPPIFLAKELVEAYPEAEVILVEREIEAWLKTFDVIAKGFFHPGNKIIATLDPKFMGRIYAPSRIWMREEFHATSRKTCMANAREAYYKHYAHVKTLVPKERLLEYELGSGWDPLCAFLGKEVPDVLFPRVNESAIMQEKVDIVIVRTALTALTNLALVVGGIVTLAFTVY